MANTYHKIYLQTVFAVKYRRALLDKKWRKKVFAVMGNLINQSNCKTLIVNGVEDHVHCFFSMKPVVSVSDVMKNVKAKSSKFINEQGLTRNRFEWQKGYGVFSYNQSQVDKVYRYIENQEEHHKKSTFHHEYVNLLKSFEIEYDEQYLFKEMI